MARSGPKLGTHSKTKGRTGVPQPPEAAKKKPKWRLYANGAAALSALGIIVAAASVSMPTTSGTPQATVGDISIPSTTPVAQTTVIDTDRRRVETLEELLELTPEQRSEVDIARANLLVAKATPGGEDIDIEQILKTLDQWAASVAFDTDRHLYKFHADPADYENSEGYFRMLSLITVLQQDCGVRYNPERIAEPDFTNSGDLFIHGIVGGEGGTCVSMPVLYTAIARRLGYPVSLVTTKGHVFARWEDESGERFNIEATNQGLTVHTDEHYRAWPFPITDDEIERFGFLKSLSLDESIAVFMGSMGHALADIGRDREAIQTYFIAATLDPDNAMYAGFASQVEHRGDPLEQQIARSGERRANDPLAQLREIQEMNRRNRERMNNPNGLPGALVPHTPPRHP